MFHSTGKSCQARWQIANKVIQITLQKADRQSSYRWRRELAKFSCPTITKNADIAVEINPNPLFEPAVYRPQVVVNEDDCGKSKSAEILHFQMSGTIWRHDSQYFGKFEADRNTPNMVEAAVRFCLSFLCEDLGLLMLHASGVRRDGRLWLFCGKCGTGKSTIAGVLNGGGEPFATDQVILGLDRDNDVFAFPTPFSDHDSILADPQPGKVAGIALIEQSDTNKIVPITPLAAIRGLLKESLTFSRSTEIWDQTVGILERLVGTQKCFKLRFKKDPSFWQLLDDSVK